jgi:predicted nucleic acid-binding Zn ribbon protein
VPHERGVPGGSSPRGSTERGGRFPRSAADPARLPRAERLRRAAAALADAKADARQRGEWPASRQGGKDDAAERMAGGGPAGAGGRARRDDPQPLAAAIGGLLSERGWQQRAALGAVFGNWGRIVGQDLAAHTRPGGFSDGELVVVADSTAWATQVRLLAPMLVSRINAEAGEAVVRAVRVRGPGAASRGRGAGGRPGGEGRLRVPGSRGPRDTYG